MAKFAPALTQIHQLLMLDAVHGHTATAPLLGVPGAVVQRPNTGTVARPNTGTVARPNTGTVARPNTGIIVRP